MATRGRKPGQTSKGIAGEYQELLKRARTHNRWISRINRKLAKLQSKCPHSIQDGVCECCGYKQKGT